MKDISLEELLEAGCHFGHQVTRQNPKAREFVFEARDGIHIIDLAKTKEGLDEALEYVRNLGGVENSTILIVGTKRQAAPILEEEVKRAHEKLGAEDQSVFYVSKRWIGGTLTNSPAMVKNFAKYKDLEKKLRTDEEKENYTKKEIGQWQKELAKLQYYYSGVVNMKAMPSALFVVDTHMEYLAVREANRMNIPVVGIVDTNADPDPIQYVIPANDDAVGSLKLLIGSIVDAWIEGKTNKDKGSKTKDKEESKVETKTEAKPVEKETKPKVEKKAPVKRAESKAKVEKKVTKGK